MANGLMDFVKSGTKGAFNQLAIGGYILSIGQADNKLKAVLKSLKDFALFNTRLFVPVAFLSAWTGLNHTIKAILKDTGSLDAALRRMASIQSFQHNFAPLLGGLTAAKQRVAELIQLSAKGPFKFEELAGASRSLEVLTRGGFSGVKAMAQIQTTAAASGNSVEETASSVGKFYAELRSGQPIASASEELRQMGIISQGTSDTLAAMALHGASNAAIFDQLTNSLAGTSDAMKNLAEDAASIQQAHEKAGEGLKVAFGAPFAEKDLQNTKNYTAAMQAVTPAVGRVSQFLSVLTTAFSTLKSSVVATVAQNENAVDSLEGLAKAGATVIGVGTAISSIALGTWVTGLATGFTVAGVAAGTLGVSLIALPFVAVAGIVMNYTAQMNKATDAMLALGRANKESTDKLKQQISDIKTLADWHEALTAALKAETDAQDQLNKAKDKEQKEIEKTIKIKRTGAGGLSAKQEEEYRQSQTGTSNEVIAGQLNKNEKAKAVHDLTTKGPGGNLTSNEYKDAYRKSAELALEGEERAFEEARSRPGIGALAATKERAATLKHREDTAAAGRKALEDLPRQRDQAAGQVALAQERLEIARRHLESAKGPDKNLEARKRFNQANTVLEVAKLNQEHVGFRAPEGTSVRLNAEAEQARKRGDFKGASRFEVQAEKAKDFEADTSQRSRALSLQAEEDQRAQTSAREQERIELAAKRTRRGTPGGKAGNTLEAEKLEDTLHFAKHYDELAHLPEEERRSRAGALAQEDIFQTANTTGLPQVASSLQRIGGGGGSYSPGGDPMLRLGERQRSLLESINGYLKTLSGTGGGVK